MKMKKGYSRILAGGLTVLLIVGNTGLSNINARELPGGNGIRSQSEMVEELLQQDETIDAEAAKQVRAILWNCTKYGLRKEPGGTENLVTMYSGQQLMLRSLVIAEDGTHWYEVEVSVSGIQYQGYIEEAYVLCNDVENFDKITVQDWSVQPEPAIEEPSTTEETSTTEEMTTAGEVTTTEELSATEETSSTEEPSATEEVSTTEESTTEPSTANYNTRRITNNSTLQIASPGSRIANDNFEASIAGFPESYKASLRALHVAHPNWVFVPQITNVDWNTFISEEMLPERSLVPRSMDDAYKGKQSWAYNPQTGEYYGLSGYNWVQASQTAVEYYADPRNFLSERDIFQFELLTYNSTYQNEAGVEAILSGTFMSHTMMPDDIVTYGKAFCLAGAQTNVSPYMLAARAKQEQGVAGTSPLISGTYPGYEGLYNFFNISF